MESACRHSNELLAYPPDANTGMNDSSKGPEPKLPGGPITRTRDKKIKSVFQNFVGQFLEERPSEPTLKNKE